MAVNITAFRLNGMEAEAAADGPRLDVFLGVEGPAATARLTLLDGETTVFDTGERPWTPNFTLEEVPLAPCRRYRALARVADEAGERARAELNLYTGLLGRPWAGRWVEPVQEEAVAEGEIQFFEQFVPSPTHLGGHDRLRPAQVLRRTFPLSRAPARALLYATARGVYTLRVNGQMVDARRLAPETTPYEKLTYYQVYDLTHMLTQGANALEVLLGDGWWAGRIGLTGDSCQYGSRLAFLCQLELTYPDGATQTLPSGAGFEGRASTVDYADLFMGEKWDLTAMPGPWQPCRVLEEEPRGLALQPIPPIQPWTRLEPRRIFTTPAGELVADFGQCLAGVVEAHLTCPRGTVVTLDHSETLDPEGNFFRNILGRNKDQQDRVVCAGGLTEFCPWFTYHGFRYVRLTGAKPEEVESLTALALGTPLEPLGDFACADERLNQLQHNIRWSTRSNMVSVPTDCPQREKAGWTGDILAFAATGCFNYDLQGFLSAWLGQMRLSQGEDGEVPIVVPSYPAQTQMQRKTFGSNHSAAWSDACVLLPLELYRAGGDRRVLADNLPMMEKWLAFVARRAAEGGDPYLWTQGYHFGDWLIPSFQDDVQGGTAATAPATAAFQYAVTLAAFGEVLAALDAPAQRQEENQALLAKVRQAAARRFIRPDGSMEGDLQGPYVMALYSGAARGELAEKVAGQLARCIRENGACLDTGFVSVPHLLDELTRHGYEDLAWQLLFQTKSPSWLYQVERGATCIWENWNAIRPDGTVTASSFNHYALGCVGDWMYRHVGGLRRAAPGWAEIEFAPAGSCPLSWARCSQRTPYGLAACQWRREGEAVHAQLTVPAGVKGWLLLPDGQRRALSPGVHSVTL